MENIAKHASNALGLFQPNADITTWMVLAGKEYELKNFKISFSQETDLKGKPQHEMRGAR